MSAPQKQGKKQQQLPDCEFKSMILPNHFANHWLVIKENVIMDKICCTICDPNGKWISQQGLKAHLDTITHQNHVSASQAGKDKQAAKDFNHQSVYNTGAWSWLNPLLPTIPTEPRPSPFQASAQASSYPRSVPDYFDSHLLDNPWDQSDGDTQFDPEVERKHLEAQARALIAEAQQANEFGAGFYDEIDDELSISGESGMILFIW
jgi:hypothetical protein